MDKNACNHILGYEEGVDESWLVYASDGKTVSFDCWPDVRFTFCPLCGERLKT